MALSASQTSICYQLTKHLSDPLLEENLAWAVLLKYNDPGITEFYGVV